VLFIYVCRTNETEKDLIESRSSVFEVHTNKQCKVIKNQNDDLLQSRLVFFDM